MEPVYEFGLEATRWMQAAYPQLVSFFRLISALGEENFYLAILPLIYWSLDKRLGKQLGYIFLISVAFNPLLKQAFRGPRPFWLDETLRLSTAEGYGVPSGHTQQTTVLYLFAAAWLRRGWVWLLAIVMVITMALSRIYLGVHFVHDTAAGLLVGLVLLGAFWLWLRYGNPGFSRRILGQRMLVALLVPLTLALMYALTVLAVNQFDWSPSWAALMPEADAESLAGMATAVGSLLGFGVGILLEGSRVRFRTQGALWQRVARYAIGIVVTLALWSGLSAIFPRDPLWLAIPLRILRYFLTLLWVSYYAPLVFVRLRLAERDPEPGISLKM